MTKETASKRISAAVRKPTWTRTEIYELLESINDNTEIEFNDLLFYAARSTGANIKGLLSSSRDHDNCLGRYLIFDYMKKKGHTVTSIGRKFNRNHTTVIAGINALMEAVEYGHLPSVEAFNKFKELTR